MCGRKKPRSMIDRKQRGSNDLEVIIYDLKKQIDILREEIQAKELELKKLRDND
jgi:predicted metalloprotease